MEPAGLTVALVVEAVRLVRGTAQRVRQISANRETLEFLAARLAKLETALTAAQQRGAEQTPEWRAAVEEMMVFLKDKVEVFLEGMAKRANLSGLQRVRQVGKANWEAEQIKMIERRLDVFVADLNLQVTAEGFIAIGEGMGDVRDKVEDVGENLGQVLQRMLVLERLVAENTAKKALSAEEFMRHVAEMSKESRRRDVRPLFEAAHRPAVGGSAPAPAKAMSGLVPKHGGGADARPVVQPLSKQTEARLAAVAAGAANTHTANSSADVLAAHAAVAETELAQARPSRFGSDEGPAAPGSTVTQESAPTLSGLLGKEMKVHTMGSDGVGGTADAEYKAMSELRSRLEKQVPDLLSSVVQNPALKKEAGEIQDVVRSLWEPWNLDPRRIVFERKKSGQRRVLGKGGYGTVYMATIDRGDGTKEEVAVKELDREFTTEKLRADFKREADLMYDLSHPCVLSFIGASWPEKKPSNSKTMRSEGATKSAGRRYYEAIDDEDDEEGAMLVTERMTCSLKWALDEEELLDNDRVKVSVMRDVAEGMVYLHSKRVVHMDLKLENILVRLAEFEDVITGRAKIADFGVSQTKRDTRSRTMTRVAGTKIFMAPELMRANRKLRLSSDVWSFGVMLVCLFSDMKEVEDLNDDDISREAYKGTLHKYFEGPISRIQNTNVRALAQLCVVDQAQDRPTFVGIRDVLRAIMNGDPDERISFCLDYCHRDHLFRDGVKLSLTNRAAGIALMNRAVGLASSSGGPNARLVSMNSEISNGLRVFPQCAVQAIEWNEAALRSNFNTRAQKAIRGYLLNDFLRADKCAALHESEEIRMYLSRYARGPNVAVKFFSGLVLYRSSKRRRNELLTRAAHRLFLEAYQGGDTWAGVFLSAMLSDAAAFGIEMAAAKVKPMLEFGANCNCALSLNALGSWYSQNRDGNKDQGAAKLCFMRAIELDEHYMSPYLLARLLHSKSTKFGTRATSEERLLELCGMSMTAGNVLAARLAAEYFLYQRRKLPQAETYAARAVAIGDRNGSALRLQAVIATLLAGGGQPPPEYQPVGMFHL